MSNVNTTSATETIVNVNTSDSPKKEKKAKAVLTPALGEYLESVLRDAKSQKGLYEATMPPELRSKVRNGKAGLRITSIRDAIAEDDEHGQAYLVSCKVAEAIESALELGSNLSLMRAKAKEKALGKK
jgi:hypothetical protein